MSSLRLVLICLAALAAAVPAFAQPVNAIEAAMGSVVRIEPGWSRSSDPTGLMRGLGTGFVIDEAGRIVTNAHVVGEAEEVVLVSPDGERRLGAVVGTDPLTDIALIAPEGGAFASPLPTGDGGALRRGERVYAIGNPIAFPFSVTEGIVSGLSRAYDPAWPVDFIQHDAAINPGSSGGPLIDAGGRVVGMNTATPAETLFDIGIGLAIPIGQVRAVAEALARDGAIERGGLGVVVRGADAEVLARLGAAADHGLLVDEVSPGSSAEAAGLRSGDVILAAQGRALRYPRDLTALLLDSRPGQRFELEVVADGRRRVVSLPLGASQVRELSHGRISQEALTPRERRGDGTGLIFASSGEAEGVLINEVPDTSLAAAYGVRRGDILLAVDGRAVSEPGAARAALEAGGEVALLRLRRPGRGVRHLALPLTEAAAARRPPGSPTDLGSGPL